MSNASFLTAEVARIVDRLSSLPGRFELCVETKRYPRLLPAESGAGYEQKSWSFNSEETLPPSELAIPPDVEEVVVTWRGGGEAKSEIDSLLGEEEQDGAFPASWDCETFTRQRESENPQIILRVFRCVSTDVLN